MSRKRMSLDEICSDDGYSLVDFDDKGERINAAWGLVFEEKERSEDDADFVLRFVPQGVVMSGWSWPMV